MIYVEGTWCSFWAGWGTPAVWGLFEEQCCSSAVGLFLRDLILTNLVLFQGLLRGLMQMFLVPKLFEKYVVAKMAPIGWSSRSSAVGLGCGWCCAEPGVGLGDPWGLLPTQNVLWFCVKCLSLTWREKGHNWLHSCLLASQIVHDWGLGERQSWQQPGPFWMSWDAWWWC